MTVMTYGFNNTMITQTLILAIAIDYCYLETVLLTRINPIPVHPRYQV